MSWQGRDEVWRARLERRLRRSAWTGVAFIAATGVLVAGVGFVLVRPLPAGIALLVGLGLGAFHAMMAIAMVVVLLVDRRRTRRIIDLVPQLDGRACPHCIQEVKLDGTALRCPGCSRTFAADELQEYWELYSASPKSIAATHALQAAPPRLGVAAIARPQNWILPIAAASIVLLAAVSGHWQNLLLVAAALGAMFAWSLHLRARRLAEARCSACGQLKPPTGDVPRRCPECGADWLAHGGTARDAVMTARARRWRLVAVAIVSVGLLLFVAYFAWLLLPAPIVRILPSDWIIHQALTRNPVPTAWDELSRRQLAPDQRTRLLEGAIERLDAGDLDLLGHAWLANELGSGTLSDAQVARLLGVGDLTIAQPGPGDSGDQTKVRLNVRACRLLAPAHTAFILVRGFQVDGQPASAPSDRPLRAAITDDLTSPMLTLDLPASESPQPPQHVRFTAWWIIAPHAVHHQAAQWNDDGTPIMPKGTTWSTRIDRELVIEPSITPAP